MSETTIEWTRGPNGEQGIALCERSVFRPSVFGPKPAPPRDGDAKQARQRINVLVRTGRIPRPNSLPCKDCGHIWVEGERRHEYDHHHGYGANHHYCVEAVCTLCHAKRDNARAQQTQCVRGHQFTPENTYLPPEGGRVCRECTRIHDRGRAPRGSAYWRNVNEKRREARNGR